MSLDQCADQYVLALSPREAVVGLSMRADDADSRLRTLARGLPQRRVSLEAALAARPQVVVRYWGGDPKMVRALEARGVRVVTIEGAEDFDGVRANVRRVAAALEQPARGAAVIARMDADLARAADAWDGAEAAYLTPGAITAGHGTLIDAILRAAGLRNAETRMGFREISLEAIALKPPAALVLGFFDTAQLSGSVWSPGRHEILQKAARTSALASLPGAFLGCPDPGAAEAAARLGRAAR